MHAHMHAYIHTYIHACIHACMHACRHAYIHKYIQTDRQPGRQTDRQTYKIIQTYMHKQLFIDVLRPVSVRRFLLALASMVKEVGGGFWHQQARK